MTSLSLEFNGMPQIPGSYMFGWNKRLTEYPYEGSAKSYIFMSAQERYFLACHIVRVHWHVSSIFAITPISVPFSKAAATRSLSASCLLTSSAVLCVPSLIRTSTRKRGGRDCSSRTRTPRPMTVARLQCVIVGVMRTVTVRRGEAGTYERVGVIEISGRDTTARAPNDIGCSGSDIVDTRSSD